MATAIQSNANQLSAPTTWHTEIIEDPESLQSSCNRASILWKIAAITTAVAFVAFAAVATVFACLYAPIYLPVLSAALLLFGLDISFQAFKYMWDKSKSNGNEAEFHTRVVTEMQKLDTPEKVQNGLKQYGIQKIDTTVDPKNLYPRLRAVFARVVVLNEMANQQLKEAAELQNKSQITINHENQDMLLDAAKARSIRSVDFKKPETIKAFNKVALMDSNSEEAEHIAAVYRSEAAFLLNVIQNPHKKTDDNVYTVLPLSAEMRQRQRGRGDVGADDFLRIGNKPFTMTQVNDGTVAQLSKALFNTEVVEAPAVND